MHVDAIDLCLQSVHRGRDAQCVSLLGGPIFAKVDGINMHDLAREVVAISEAGLKARARPGAGGLVPDETHFLNALKETIETGKTPADELLDRYHGDWNGDISRIYEDYSY